MLCPSRGKVSIISYEGFFVKRIPTPRASVSLVPVRLPTAASASAFSRKYSKFFFSEVFAATITAAQITYYHGDPVAFAIVVVEFFYYLVSHTHTRRVRNILAGPTIIFRRWFKCTTERRVYIYPGNSVNVTSSSQTSVNTVISPYIGRHSLSSFSTTSFFFASSSSIYTRPALLLLYIIFASIYIVLRITIILQFIIYRSRRSFSFRSRTDYGRVFDDFSRVLARDHTRFGSETTRLGPHR